MTALAHLEQWTLALVVLVAVGCGGSGSNVSTTPTVVSGDTGSLAVAIPPANATPFGSAQFPWAANFTVNLLEQGGFAVDVMEIDVELASSVVFDEASIKVAARTNRVEARGTLAIPLSIALEDAAIDARVIVRGTDERGNALESVGRLIVIPAQRP